MKRVPRYLALSIYALVFSSLTMSAAFTMQACAAAKARHATVVVDQALYEAISDIHALEQNALCGAPSCAGVAEKPVSGWSHEKSVAFNKKLLPASEAGRQLNTRLAAWKSGEPVPVEVQQLVTGLSDSLSAITADFPAGTTRESILTKIATAQRVALSLLSSVLTIAGK